MLALNWQIADNIASTTVTLAEVARAHRVSVDWRDSPWAMLYLPDLRNGGRSVAWRVAFRAGDNSSTLYTASPPTFVATSDVGCCFPIYWALRERDGVPLTLLVEVANTLGPGTPAPVTVNGGPFVGIGPIAPQSPTAPTSSRLG
jgi:hypothetical protein